MSSEYKYQITIGEAELTVCEAVSCYDHSLDVNVNLIVDYYAPRFAGTINYSNACNITPDEFFEFCEMANLVDMFYRDGSIIDNDILENIEFKDFILSDNFVVDMCKAHMQFNDNYPENDINGSTTVPENRNAMIFKWLMYWVERSRQVPNRIAIIRFTTTGNNYVKR